MSILLRRLRLWLGIATLLAAVVTLGWLSQRYPLQVHVAAAGELELGEASRRLLAHFEEPVRITAFVDPGSALRGHISRLLSTYRSAKADLQFDIVDPDQRPELVRELAVTRRGEVVVEYRGRRERAMAPTQARISAALERLLFEADPYIAFVTGHGERDLLGLANFDMGQFGRQLQRKGYRIQPWRLSRGQPVPDNANLLVVAGPQSPLSAGERAALADYLDRGGALLWLTEPAAGPQRGALGELLGVRRRPGVVVDPSAGALLAVDDPRLLLLDGDLQHEAVAIPEAPVLLPRAAALEADPPSG
ncbi:GldG family protein, partial [Ectothiorhodospiraceae bacterium WFHF3C12]|nr:GldG family protein [Ectothiorhodospiraceae bacterium WFHF3C12]